MHVTMLLDTSEVLEGPSPPAERFCRSRSDSPPQSARNYSWAELMRRVWSNDLIVVRRTAHLLNSELELIRERPLKPAQSSEILSFCRAGHEGFPDLDRIHLRFERHFLPA